MSKERRRRNLQILFSVAAAIALWLFVAFSENTPITMWERNVEVDVQGEETLAEKGLVMVMANPPTVDVQMSGSRRGFFQKKDGDVTAQIDVSRIDRAGTYTVNVRSDVSIRNASVSEISPAKLDVVIEPLVTETKEVDVKTSGSCASGFSVSSVDCPTVKVTGPQSIVSDLTVTADAVPVDGANKDVVKRTNIRLTNSNGNEVRRADSSISASVVEVVCRVQYEKDVPIEVKTAGERDEYEYEVKVSPETVMVFGTKERLRQLASISTQFIDLSEVEDAITLSPELIVPDGFKIPEDTKISVTVTPKRKSEANPSDDAGQ